MALHTAFHSAPSRYVVMVVVLLSAFQRSAQEVCKADKFDCGNGRCLNMSQLCDYFDNCVDEQITDERNCSHPPADMTKALVCTLNSALRGRSYVYKLYGNPDQYADKFGKDAYEDKLPIHMNWIYFFRYNYLRSMSIDYEKQIIYFGNDVDERLEFGYFIYMNETFTRFFDFIPETNQTNGMALDWITRNIYWTDGLYRVIAVKPLAVRHHLWKAIVDKNLSSPQDVAVNPIQNYLFWSDGTGSNAKIERSDLSGKNRIVLVKSAEGLVSPTTLVIDFSTQKLYWLDSGAETIGHVNFDGLQRSIKTISILNHVSAMTIYRNYIYFGHNEDPVIYIYNKTSLNSISSYRLRESGGVTDMGMFAPGVQPSASSPCTRNYGGCSHFCWTTSANTKVCDCAPGFFLSKDGKTCTVQPFWEDEEYIVVADYKQQNIYQLKPVTGELRALPMKTCRPISLVFDPSESRLYVLCNDTASARYYYIQKKTLDDRIGETIYSVPQSFSEVISLAMDTKRRRLYYTDNKQGIIAEITTSGVRKRKLLMKRGGHPRAIVVDSNSGRMYWSDCSGETTTIHTARIEDEGDHQTLISDDQRSCIVDIAIDFHNQMMYWVSVGNPAVEMAFLDGTGRVALLNETKANYTGITLYKDSLYISDSRRRNLIKFNLTSQTKSLQPPGVFVDAHDVLYFNKDEGISNQPTTRSPVSDENTGEDNEDSMMIITISASVGGLIVLVIVVALTVQICVSCRRRRRPAEPRSPATITLSQPAIPLSATSMHHQIHAGAVGAVNDAFHNSGPYEQLQYATNIYETVDEAPPLRPVARQPPPPVKPKPRKSVDDDGYLKLRKTRVMEIDQKEPEQERPT